MFLEIRHDTRRITPYYYGLFRETYRKDGKVCHRTRGRITGLPLSKLQAIQEFFRQGCPFLDRSWFPIKSSREYGAVASVWQTAQSIALPRMLYSRSERWVKYVMAMIVGRVVYQGSKLYLTHLCQDTCLWSLCGVDTPDVDQCYEAMDRLLQRQGAIQKALVKKHLSNGCVVLYDVTSSYFEGEYADSELVQFGYNRDGKRGHKQVVIGLMTDAQGCPVGVSVYKGNTHDQVTVADRVRELKEEYRLKELILVGDRGMLTAARLAELSEAGLRTITALTHPQLQKLIDKGVFYAAQFQAHAIAEIYDPDHPDLRYMLCHNPTTAQREKETRKALLAKTTGELQLIAISKKKRTVEEIGAAVGKVLAHWKMGKFVDWRVDNGLLQWTLNEEKIQHEETLDGCYVIRTDLAGEIMDKEQTVACYRRLETVERAFRQIKTVSLEIRPTYHQLDRRIEAHVFLCMLAYYVEWHMKQRLQPLFDRDGKGKNRRWTFAGILERLKGIREQTGVFKGSEVVLRSAPDEVQEEILSLLQANI